MRVLCVDLRHAVLSHTTIIAAGSLRGLEGGMICERYVQTGGFCSMDRDQHGHTFQKEAKRLIKLHI